MDKIIKIDEAIKVAREIREQNNSIVLVGGCFDIVHVGHVRFLQKAKEQGDVLMILLESDEKVTELKGHGRPIHSQKERAEVLGAFSTVDYVIPLPIFTTDSEYENLVGKLFPNIIAVTENDKGRTYKEHQAQKVGGMVKTVIGRVQNKSTSQIERLLQEKW